MGLNESHTAAGTGEPVHDPTRNTSPDNQTLRLRPGNEEFVKGQPLDEKARNEVKEIVAALRKEAEELIKRRLEEKCPIENLSDYVVMGFVAERGFGKVYQIKHLRKRSGPSRLRQN